MAASQISEENLLLSEKPDR